MKRIISILILAALLTGILGCSVLGAGTLTAQGWSSDSSDLSGWSLSGGTITGNYDSMVNKRIFKDCLTDMRSFTVEMDVSSSNISSPYIQILGVVLELDANNGSGDQVFVKLAGQTYDWIEAKGTKVHVSIRRDGGDLQVSLTGDGSSQVHTYSATPVQGSTLVEIGMYRGGTVAISNFSVTVTGDGTNQGSAIDYNTLVIPVTAGEHFEFRGTGDWREDTGWTAGVSTAQGIWLQSAIADGSDAKAVYMTEKLTENWKVGMTFHPLSNDNGGRTVCRTVFMDSGRGSVMLLTMEHLTADGKVKFTWQTASGDGWTEVWKESDWVAASDTAFTVCLEKKSDTTVALTITGDQGYQRTFTGTVPSDVMDSISRVGVGTERSAVRITDFTVTSSSQSRDYTALARQTYRNLLRNYLDTENNWISPVRWGFKNGDVTNTGRTVSVSGVGEVWESTVMMMALDTYAQTLQKGSAEWEEVARIIANTVNMLNSGYTEKQMTTAASAPNYAMDDCGWNVMGMLLGYYYNRELGNTAQAAKCLKYAKGLFNSSYDTFYTETLGGLAYTAAKSDVSLYGATMALAGYYINLIEPDSRIAQRYMDIYNGIENNLRRPDGLYWCGSSITGPSGAANPYGISEAGSVSYLGGNMAMAVLNALLGNEQKVEQTVLGIVRYESYSTGAFMNDRDAWNNTFFLGMFVREVIGRDIAGDVAQRALNTTVTMVLENACFDDGYYSASWQGPREPSSIGYPSQGDYSTEGRNNWGKGYNNDGLNIGSTPNQIMTSATTAHVLLAAALSATYEDAQPEPPVTEPDDDVQPEDPVEDPTDAAEQPKDPTEAPTEDPTEAPTDATEAPTDATELLEEPTDEDTPADPTQQTQPQQPEEPQQALSMVTVQWIILALVILVGAAAVGITLHRKK